MGRTLQNHLNDITLRYCSIYPNNSVGEAYLKVYKWNYHRYIFWVGPLVILAWIFWWNFATFLSIEYQLGNIKPREFWVFRVFARFTEKKKSVFQKKNGNTGKISDANRRNVEIFDKNMLREEELVPSLSQEESLEEKAFEENTRKGFEGEEERGKNPTTFEKPEKKKKKSLEEGEEVGNGNESLGFEKPEIDTLQKSKEKVVREDELREFEIGTCQKSTERNNGREEDSRYDPEFEIDTCRNLKEKKERDRIFEGGNRESTTGVEDVEEGTRRELGYSGGEKQFRNVLRFQKVVLSWHNLSYEVMPPGARNARQILLEVSGWAKPGEILAISGSPGTGKTTLIDCLAWRTVNGRMGGSVLSNGFPRERSAWIRSTGYVHRAEVYPPYLTVEENMLYKAVMNLPSESTKRERERLVEEILRCADIWQLRKRLTSQLVRGGSSTEKLKRLATAMELAANPSVLFFDAPLLGMDDRQGSLFVQTLEHIASAMERTLVLTIDVPMALQLNSFKNILILKRGGEMVYFGEPGIYGSKLLEFFQSIPGTPPPPPNINPISYVQNIIGDGITERKSIRDYAFEYRMSDRAIQSAVQLSEFRRNRGKFGPKLQFPDRIRTYFLRMTNVFVNIQLMYWRNVGYTFNRLIYSVLIALILGFLYYDLSPTTFTGMNTRGAFIFASVVFGGTAHAGSAVAAVAEQRVVIANQRASKQYPVLWHTIAHTIAEIPYSAFSTLVFVAISASLANVAVDTPKHFFEFWFTFFCLSLAITYLGLFLAIVFPQPKIASVLIPMITGAWITTGGYILPKTLILDVYKVVFWSNPLQFALNTMSAVAFFCDTEAPECQPMGCKTDPSFCPLCPCPRVTDFGNVFVWDLLKQQRSLQRDRVGLDWLFLLGFCLLCRVGTYIALRVLRHNTQPLIR